ncbi:MAG: carbohydrate kinase family protein [Actinobacteria bacterium]|nr:carbohydrate kinase family protein [Actinomycetota bacterium]
MDDAQTGRGPDDAAGLDLVVAGRGFYDLVMSGVRAPEPGAEVFATDLTVAPGGAATRAVAGARLGLATALVAAVGADPFGDQLRALLAAEPGLRTGWVQRVEGARTAVTVALTDTTDRSFVTYEEPGTAVPLTVAPPLPAVRACHVGVADSVPGWVTELRLCGTLVVGGVGWDETGAWSPAVLDRLAGVDAFVPNADEAVRYTRTDDPLTATARLAERVGLVCTTLGGDGAYALDAGTGEQARVPAPRTAVVDPTGAGDCFVAAFTAGRVRGLDLRTTVAFAVLSASLSVARLGGASSAPGAGEVAAAVRAGLDRDDLPAADWDAVLAVLDPGVRAATSPA